MNGIHALLSASLLLVTSTALGYRPDFLAPVPIRPQHSPLLVTSPVRVDWEGGDPMTVEIHRNGEQIFPTSAHYEELVSGCDFSLDPGIYRITVRTPTCDSPGSATLQITTWVEVEPQQTAFDLRAEGPATRHQVRTLGSLLHQTQDQVDAVSSQVGRVSSKVEKISDRMTPIEDGLLLLLKQFTLVDNTGDAPRTIDRPFQWLGDRLQEIETKANKK